MAGCAQLPDHHRRLPHTYGAHAATRRTYEDDTIEAATTYGEELADHVVDTDLWLQALAYKRQQRQPWRGNTEQRAR
ncbi:MAG TPA: hypothetical protein VGP82_25240 [Ktedonobacterales bacterium]|nr:hypothetical protein [Ktedonobacterales bacterium]